ncbi:MAG: hypothetical protein R2728_08490 [Chitinophagales bacterium]
MKRTWVNYGKYRDWTDTKQRRRQRLFKEKASQINKNIWIPYGEAIV